jgi:hypothetical protein
VIDLELMTKNNRRDRNPDFLPALHSCGLVLPGFAELAMHQVSLHAVGTTVGLTSIWLLLMRVRITYKNNHMFSAIKSAEMFIYLNYT